MVLTWSTMMSYNKLQMVPIRTLIQNAWESDQEGFLKKLGGINTDGSLNEARIQQIKETVRSLIGAEQDDEKGPLGR